MPIFQGGNAKKVDSTILVFVNNSPLRGCFSVALRHFLEGGITLLGGVAKWLSSASIYEILPFSPSVGVHRCEAD